MHFPYSRQSMLALCVLCEKVFFSEMFEAFRNAYKIIEFKVQVHISHISGHQFQMACGLLLSIGFDR